MKPGRQDRIAALVDPRPRLMRTVFLSFPATPQIRKYVEGELAPAVRKHFGYLVPVSCLNLKTGRWLPTIEHAIHHCNAIVAFISDHNPNVMLELGRAMALGKPIIPVIQEHQSIPSMLTTDQAVKYKGLRLTPRLTQKIIAAINEAVFVVLERGHSDERTKMQKRLLLGSRESRPRPTHQSRTTYPTRKAIMSRAWSEFEAGHFRKVIRILSPATQRGKGGEDAYHLLADTWFLHGESTNGRKASSRYARMNAVADLGLDKFSDSFLLRKDRALALMKLQHLAAADAGFSELAREGENPMILYNLACVKSLMGDRFQALAFLDRAVVLQPYYKELARVDPDFDPLWEDVLFQALVFQARGV